MHVYIWVIILVHMISVMINWLAWFTIPTNHFILFFIHRPYPYPYPFTHSPIHMAIHMPRHHSSLVFTIPSTIPYTDYAYACGHQNDEKYNLTKYKKWMTMKWLVAMAMTPNAYVCRHAMWWYNKDMLKWGRVGEVPSICIDIYDNNNDGDNGMVKIMTAWMHGWHGRVIQLCIWGNWYKGTNVDHH